MIPSSIPVVCLATGEAHGATDLYVRRLHSMLRRYSPVPFSLICYSDRKRQVPREVEVRSCQGWTELMDTAMRPTTLKLGFFDAEKVPFDEFLYLDLSLVIRRDMSELIKFAFNSSSDLVIVNDWHHPSYNSSVMRIRRGALQTIYDGFSAGQRYSQKVRGDQEFIFSHLRALALQDRVELFPESLVVSYKNLKALNRTNPQAAQNAVEAATIVKFHGRTKMHQLLSPLDNLRYVRKFRFSRQGQQDAHFFVKELSRHWNDD